MKKILNIIIMGPQGSGKGTQARLLAKKYDLQIFETGSILRKTAKQNTVMGNEINDIINKKGGFVAWKPYKKKIFDQEAKKLNPKNGILFDGTPREMVEVEYWDKKLNEMNRKINFVFYIDVSDRESLKRLMKRKLCRKNGHPLIVGKDIAEDDNKCPICGSIVYRRADDTKEKIMRRLEWNKKVLEPVVKYYKKTKMFVKINGEQSISNVHKEIISNIEN